MKPTRRTLLALIGLAPAAPLLAKIPTIQTAPSRVHWLLEGPAGTGKTRAAQNLRGIDPTAPMLRWTNRSYTYGDLFREKYAREAEMHHRLDTLGYQRAWRRT